MSHQGVGVHDGDKLMQEVRLGDEELWGQPLHHGLQLLGSKPWYMLLNIVQGTGQPSATKCQQCLEDAVLA